MGNLIVKDNALIEASHKLGDIEQKLVLLAILKARETCQTVEQLKDKELTIYASDYINTFKVEKHTAYGSLKSAVMGLFDAKWGYKYINENGNVAVRHERFTQSAEYVKSEGLVRFTFSNAIIPFLMELEKRFTVYEIEQVSQLSSGYAIRLYEFFMQYFDKRTGRGWLEISLEDLRFRFGLLPNEYERIGNFKTRVLDYSIKEINDKTNLTVTYEQRKKGRVIVGFRFEFMRNKSDAPETKPQQQSLFRQPEPDLFAGFSEIERTAIQEWIDEHIKRIEQSGELVSDFHRANITKKAISERWGLDILAKQQEQKQKDAEINAVKQSWENLPNGTRFQHKKDGSMWVKEFDCLRNDKGTVPESLLVDVLQNLEIISEKEENQKQIDQDLVEYHAKIEAKLAEVRTMADGQLFRASDGTVYKKIDCSFFNVTRPEDTKPRSLRDAARAWSMDSWKPIDKMPEPSTRSRIFQYYATEEDILRDRENGLNPLDYLTNDEKEEVNELIQDYQENKDPEIYEFIVNILGIQLDEPKKPSLMARLKRQN